MSYLEVDTFNSNNRRNNNADFWAMQLCARKKVDKKKTRASIRRR